MKNYPLLPLNNEAQWQSWRETYLTEINHQVHSLWDYVNFFLPDYCEYNLDRVEGHVDATTLPYNGFYRATIETNVWLKNTDPNVTLKPGFLLVSKARNENGTDDIIMNIDNYFVQPFGYGSFYLYTFQNGQLQATYDQYAEEKYGLNYMFSLFPTYPRFILKTQGLKNNFLWVASAYESGAPNIFTFNKTPWTDLQCLKPMVFHFVPDSNNTQYGEEIIIDTYNYNSIKIDQFNIAEYNEVVLEKGDTINIWPADIEMRMI